MNKGQKVFQKLLLSPNNARFSDVVECAKSFGFKLDRINGSHHIFVHEEIPELLNLQKVKGKAKPYQIKQLLKLIEIHNLKWKEQ